MNDEEAAVNNSEQSQKYISRAEDEIEQEEEKTGNRIEQLRQGVEEFRKSPAGQKTEQIAMDIADEIAEVTQNLETEKDQEKELVDAEFYEGKELEELVEEEETASEELEEQFVLTGKGEESAQKNGEGEFLESESQLYQMEVSELQEMAGLEKETARDLKATAENIAHAEQAAEGTKSQAEMLKDIAGQFTRTLDETQVGQSVANKAREKTNRAVEGLDNIVSELSGVMQEAAKAGQELGRAAQEGGIMFQELGKAGQEAAKVGQELGKAGQTGAQAADKVMGTVKNTAEVGENLTQAAVEITQNILDAMG